MTAPTPSRLAAACASVLGESSGAQVLVDTELTGDDNMVSLCRYTGQDLVDPSAARQRHRLMRLQGMSLRHAIVGAMD